MTDRTDWFHRGAYTPTYGLVGVRMAKARVRREKPEDKPSSEKEPEKEGEKKSE